MSVSPARAWRNRIGSAAMALGLTGLLVVFSYYRAYPDTGFWTGWLPASVLIGGALFFFLTRKFRRRKRLLKSDFPAAWRHILATRVVFYEGLNADGKKRFEDEVRIFLAEKRVTGIKLELDDTTRVLVAASAVIPIFGFPEWEYDNLAEVLVYPSPFGEEKQLTGPDRDILGQVHSGGALNRIMILSKPDLWRGFSNLDDKHNVGIHEFAHLVDGADGDIDGVPAATCPECVGPWIELMRIEMERLASGDSILRRYGLTNEAEFFAVASEAFFESPARLAEEHPELYTMLERIFRQDARSKLTGAVRDMLQPYPSRLGRNSRCPCGSGKKYKRCCLH